MTATASMVYPLPRMLWIVILGFKLVVNSELLCKLFPTYEDVLGKGHRHTSKRNVGIPRSFWKFNNASHGYIKASRDFLILRIAWWMVTSRRCRMLDQTGHMIVGGLLGRFLLACHVDWGQVKESRPSYLVTQYGVECPIIGLSLVSPMMDW